MMRQRTLLVYSLYMLGGLICASQFVHSVRAGLGLLLLTTVLGIFPLYLRKEVFPRSLVLIGLVFLCVGFMYYIWTDQRNISLLPEAANVTFTGRIESAVIFDGNQCKFILRLDRLDSKELLRPEQVQTTLYFRDKASRNEAEKVLGYGTELTGPIELTIPASPTNPESFDYPAYLHWQRIHRLGKIMDMRSLSYQEAKLNFTGTMMSSQRWLADRAFTLFTPETAGLLAGMLLGAVDDIDPDVYGTFSSLGLTHIIAISGQHITLLSAGLLYVLRLCGVTKRRAYIMTALFLPLYVIMSGSSASAVRALVMGEFVLLALLVGRLKDGWNLLGAAFLLMIGYDPYYIHNVGFQLSYLVTFGLLVFVPPIMNKCTFVPLAIRSLSAITIAATLVSFPLTIYYFHIYSFLSPLINFLFVPFVSILVAPLAVVSIILGSVHPALGFLTSKVVDILLLPALRLLRIIEQDYSLRFAFESPSLWWMVGYLCWLIFLTAWLYDRITFNWKTKICLVLFPVLLFGMLFFSWPKKEVVVTFLDVGQGDAIVIETPGRTVLIDGGGPPLRFGEQLWEKRREPFNPVKSTVVPFLHAKGISSLDLVVMTHGDSDHIGGISYLLEHMPVRQVLVNGLAARTEIEKKVNELLHYKRIPIMEAKQGQVWNEEPGIVWRVLNPVRTFSPEGEDNAYSVVLWLEAYGSTFLFTGDLEQEGEMRLLHEKAVGPVDVLKVGHHGSRTSTSKPWVEALSPRLSVISAGKKNRYGHPHREVIERLTTNGSVILRTDRCGAAVVRVREGALTYKTIESTIGCR
ncbi:DNA internalization-related competence protein ComEC/Rec2 [Aneurinibacillus migulanus]|uniref:DNA internalization-related competence protein ComEC/Rec2 n=1 Tax=Aneurinibacillus migulanus TaxID=47500 RepID=UPI002E1E8837|nr:DNA internalization-related competence protein ComEC/Rec2 [Aneurinibacillus migulanus]MED4728441.1 DNA internalization-related competence protein ComEC/Rec2 [Aneurinibacillus migulanus]